MARAGSGVAAAAFGTISVEMGPRQAAKTNLAFPESRRGIADLSEETMNGVLLKLHNLRVLQFFIDPDFVTVYFCIC